MAIFILSIYIIGNYTLFVKYFYTKFTIFLLILENLIVKIIHLLQFLGVYKKFFI